MWALTAAFLAREDTTTPFKQAAISVVINIAISALLTPTYGFIGVAIGAMASAWINAILLAAILLRRGFLTFDDRLRRIMPRLLLSCAGLGLSTWGVSNWVWPGSFASTLEQAIALCIIIAAGGIVFGALVLLLRVSSFAELRDLRRRR